MKVLVIEDSKKVQASLGPGLRALGYAVDAVADSRQAISRAADYDYDVILLDLMLPGDSSLLVLHEIRESNREIEILILSTHDQIHDRVTALIQGADDYLVKPFSFEELHARIQQRARRKLELAASDNNPETGTGTHLNRLIHNLLNLCQCKQGEIELVISEIKLEDLLGRICPGLDEELGKKDIELLLPKQKLPKLLVDARWMEHLLTNLLINAIRNSPTGAQISISCITDVDYCALELLHQMSQSLRGDEVIAIFKDFCNRDNDEQAEDPIALLSLVKSYAGHMNLGLDAIVTDRNQLKIRVSNIKIT